LLEADGFLHVFGWQVDPLTLPKKAELCLNHVLAAWLF